jgi:phenylpyruvate tautomerase PptA (4-oxalocrotonate tautomerase family)
MPYLKIQSNQSIAEDKAKDLMGQASRLIADQLGKSEKYVMVTLDPPRPMVFAGSDKPAVFMELKSIGLGDEQTPALSQSLCELIEQQFGVPGERVYIEFADAPRGMWGWNGGVL